MSAVLAATLSPAEIATRVVLAIAVILVLGRLIGGVFRRFGQPPVLGEIIAGILIGPTVLGTETFGELLPADVVSALRVISSVGLVIFMFIVGLEVDPPTIRRSGRKAAIISGTSMLLPFLLGAAVVGPLIHPSHDVNVQGEPIRLLDFSLFLGISVCGTAFAILARILSDRGMFRIPLGMLLVGCAAFDDVFAFALLGVVLAITGTDEGGGGFGLPLPLVLLCLVALMAALYLVVRPLLDRLVMTRFRETGSLSADGLAILLVGLFVTAWITRQLGLEFFIGAFLFGTCVPRHDGGKLLEATIDRVEGVVVTLLLPVFFVVTGTQVNLRGLGLDDLASALLIILAASVGKFVGGALSARAQGISNRQSLAVGAMMNTRGLAELVIIGIAKDKGFIDSDVFAMLVMTTVVTTMTAGPLLRLVYPERWLQHDIEQAEREALGGGVAYRAVVAVTELGKASEAVEAAVALARGGRQPAELVVSHFRASGVPHGNAPDLGGGLLGGLTELTDALAVLQDQRRKAESAGVRCLTTARLSDDPVAEWTVQVRTVKPNVVVVAAGSETATALLAQVADEPGVDAVVVVGPFDGSSVMVEVQGERSDVAALEVAARLARASAVPVRVVAGAGARRPERAVAAGIEALAEVGVHPDQAAADGDGTGTLVGALDASTDTTRASLLRPGSLLVRPGLGERRGLSESLGPAPSPTG